MIVSSYKYFEKIRKLKINDYLKAEFISDLCRINTLTMIKIAGSGHIGTSMSAMDLFVWIKHFKHHNKLKNLKSKNRNIFFSSKGHDVPALYSVLYSLGVLKLNDILKLRKIDGLDGHPDLSIKGIEANTGSLGMGISKAKGMCWAKNKLGHKGSVVVLTGDGEFQEGQIFESLQTTNHQNINNLIVIIDHNKIQSSQYVKNIIDLRDLKRKVEAFGWHVERCDGHSFSKIDQVFKKFEKVKNKPKLLIADTIKGKGLNKIEHTKVMKKNKFYNWHSGAPTDKEYNEMIKEIISRIKKKISKNRLNFDPFEKIEKNKLIKSYKSLDIH